MNARSSILNQGFRALGGLGKGGMRRTASYSAALNTQAKVGMRGSAQQRVQAKRAADRALINSGKRRALGLGMAGSVGMTAGRNPNREQTMYRGPMNTGRGIGRYS